MPDDAPSPAPPPAAPGGPGPSLDRGAVERVLARAAELQVQATAGDGTGDTISEAQLLEIGKEVGIAPAVLRQAIAEERTRTVLAVPTTQGEGLVGPAAVSASRVVPHDDAATMAALDRWLREDYDVLEKRRQPGRRTWEKRANRRPKLARHLKGNVAAGAVANATEIGATVTPLGDGRSMVRLDADLSSQRTARIGGGIAVASAGLVTGGMIATVGLIAASAAFLPVVLAAGVLPLLGGAIGGLAVARSHRAHAARAQLGLEQLLDRLEHDLAPGAPAAALPPLSLDETIDQVARGVKQVASAMAEVRKRAGI